MAKQQLTQEYLPNVKTLKKKKKGTYRLIFDATRNLEKERKSVEGDKRN